MNTLNWLTAYQLEKTSAKLNALQSDGQSPFDMKNNSQTYHAMTLSMLYGERTIFASFYDQTIELGDYPEEQRALSLLLSFYGLTTINRHMAILYEGGFAVGAAPAKLYQNAIIHLLPQIKRDAIALIDAIAPTDFILNSPLGMSDGDMYKHLESRLLSAPDALTRPTWWDRVIYRKEAKL